MDTRIIVYKLFVYWTRASLDKSECASCKTRRRRTRERKLEGYKVSNFGKINVFAPKKTTSFFPDVEEGLVREAGPL